MERGTLLAGVLAGFALATVTLVALDQPPPPSAPDTRTQDMLDHMVTLLERLERRQAAAVPVAQPAPDRQPVPADQSVDLTLAQLLTEVRSIHEILDRQRSFSEVVPAVMNVGAVRAAIELGQRDGPQLHSQLVMMPGREVLRRFGRPSGVATDLGYWTYLPVEGEQLTLYFAGNLVSDMSTRVGGVVR